MVLPNPNGTAPGLYFPPIEGRVPPFSFCLGRRANCTRWSLRKYCPGWTSWCPPGTSREQDLSHSWARRIHGREPRGCRSGIHGRAGIGLLRTRAGEVDVRLIGTPALVEAGSEIIRKKLGGHIYSESADEQLNEHVITLLRAAGASLAVAESCTGGFIASRITDVSGASDVFLAGYVTYANEAKTAALGVPAELIATHGAVSEAVAIAMAEGAAVKSGAGYALSTTGIAGPDGGTAEKPVGTIFIGLKVPDSLPRQTHHIFSSDRATFKFMASQAAFDRLRLALMAVAPKEISKG